MTPRVKYVTVQPDQVVFTPGQSLDLTGKNPWIKDDTGQAGQHVPADNIVEAVNNDESFVDLAHAHVTYASSNPAVATVSRTGKVQTIAAGAATISVTVNGVTGSTPVRVQQPFTLSVPSSIAIPGSTWTATTTLPNPSSASLSDVTMTLAAPSGWSVQATSPSTFATVAPGQTAKTTWSLTAPADAGPGNYELSAQATFTDVAGQDSVTDAATESVPYPSWAAAINNTGISDDANASAANLDGGGASYSAQALAAATPSLTPGATITHDGLTFTWPTAQPGTPDNVVAGGQTVPLTGGGSTLGLLGTGDYGTASGTATDHLHRRQQPVLPAQLRGLVGQRAHHRRRHPHHSGLHQHRDRPKQPARQRLLRITTARHRQDAPVPHPPERQPGRSVRADRDAHLLGGNRVNR